MILSIILSALDILTTWYLTSKGGIELNPLGQNSIFLFLIIKIVVLIGLTIFVIIYKKLKYKSKIINIAVIIFNIWYIFVVTNNIVNIFIFLFN